jgi:hypothetical protein
MADFFIEWIYFYQYFALLFILFVGYQRLFKSGNIFKYRFCDKRWSNVYVLMSKKISHVYYFLSLCSGKRDCVPLHRCTYFANMYKYHEARMKRLLIVYKIVSCHTSYEFAYCSDSVLYLFNTCNSLCTTICYS